MPDIIIEITGLREVEGALARLNNIGTICGPALVAGAAELQTWVKEYPPKTEANRPRTHGGWYERGRGSMYANKAGAVRVVKSSQMLNRSWSMRHTFTPDSAEVVIGTRATYAPFVHDESRQARFHKARGWRTVQEGILKFQDNIVRRIEQAVLRAAKG